MHFPAVCDGVSPAAGSETTTEFGAPTSESEDDKQRNSTPDSIPALPSIDLTGLGDFTRRFERQSWRERHEEERRRLKQRFEVGAGGRGGRCGGGKGRGE